MKLRGLTVIEFLVVICLIFILIGSFALYANIALGQARKLALQNELMNIRLSLEHYRIINAKYPVELADLCKKNILTSGDITGIIFPKQFLKEGRMDKEGCLLDPFMNRYGYNPAEGRVYSVTRGHEKW